MPDFDVRYPAYPLIVHDPFFSVWSATEELSESCPRHWTGSELGMLGLVRIDGRCYRWLGACRHTEKLPQVHRLVTATATSYVFEAAGVQLSVEFLTPALLDDLDILSRPVSYVSWQVSSLDGMRHLVDVYVEFGGQFCVNHGDEAVNGARFRCGGLDVLSLSAAHPHMLERSGDNHRIEWGRFCLGLDRSSEFEAYVGSFRSSREMFLRSGMLPLQDDLRSSLTVTHPYFAVAAMKKHSVAEGDVAGGRLLVAYDDVYCLEFLRQRLTSYWCRNGQSFGEMLCSAASDYEELARRCRAFDERLSTVCRKAGGVAYERLCTISYRQSIGAHKLALGPDGRALFFSKENFSNGCIGTVDVTYPSAPLYLWLQPQLLEGMLIPILEYAQVPGRWTFPFAPHDLGQYPLANGQVYGGGEKTEEDQMPVEECGNMLILLAALLRFHGELDFVKRYWPLLTRWADYLLDCGYDPENQLCTDDFAGHLAHNTNLSLKAIMALGGSAQMALAVGDKPLSEKYMAAAREGASRWQIDALDESGCYRLAFDQPGTWSQKYNLVWDKLLGLNLFSADVIDREMAHYCEIQGTYGLPLDNRSSYTKLDWITWCATLSGKADEFESLIKPLQTFMEETPDRVPLTDWYFTDTAKKRGFQARSVVGGVFLRLLYDMKPAELA